MRTALEVARALGPRLWGIRLDTSEKIVDRSLFESWASSPDRGEPAPRAQGARRARPGRVRSREDRRSGVSRPEDPGVRAGGRACRRVRRWLSLIRRAERLHGRHRDTDGRPSAKVGGGYRANDRLELVDEIAPWPKGVHRGGSGRGSGGAGGQSVTRTASSFSSTEPRSGMSWVTFVPRLAKQVARTSRRSSASGASRTQLGRRRCGSQPFTSASSPT